MKKETKKSPSREKSTGEEKPTNLKNAELDVSWVSRSARVVQSSPFLFATGAFAVGALASMFIPTSQAEQQYVINPAKKFFGEAKRAVIKTSREIFEQSEV